MIGPSTISLPPHDSEEVFVSSAVGRFPAGTRLSIRGLQGIFTADSTVLSSPSTSLHTTIRSNTAGYPGFHLLATVHVEECSDAVDLPLDVASRAARGGANPGFGSGGARFLDFGASDQAVSALAFDSSRRLIVGGVVGDSYETRDFVVTRLLRDGTSDPSFQTTRVDLGGEEFLDALAVQGDGRILAAGSSVDYGSGIERFAIARLLPDGGLDPSFGNGGMVVLDLSHSLQQIHGLVPRPDGSVVAIGAVIGSYGEGVATLRLDPFGQLDTSLGGGLGYRYDVPPFDLGLGPGGGQGIAIQGGNRVVVLAAGGDVTLLGLHLDGSIDSTFGANGWAGSRPEVGTSPMGDSIAVAPDGSFWVAAEDEMGGMMAGHYLSDGSVDTSISANGFVHTSHYGFYADDKVALGVRPDGRVIAGGAIYEGDEAIDLYEFLPDGAADASFGVTPQFPGEVFTMFNGGSSFAKTLLVGDDGTFYVGGYFVTNGTRTSLVLGYLQ